MLQGPRRFRRPAAVLMLFCLLCAQGALAGERDGSGRTLGDRLDRAKQFVITIFSRFGLPPG